ncbi:MAG: hypothetical protein WB791_01865 [Waddliaceae bacterium]
MSSFDEALNAVALKTGTELEKEISYLKFSGVGGSLSRDNIVNHEKLIFNINKILSKDEAVLLITKILEKYIKNLHTEKRLYCYLKKHSFTYENVIIKLFIYTKEGEDVFHPNIENFTLQNGVLSYLTVNKSEKWYYQDESYIEEPYEDAAKRLGVWKKQ